VKDLKGGFKSLTHFARDVAKAAQTGYRKVSKELSSWEDFVYYYRPFIYASIRRMNVTHHDAEEICQSVLLKAWKKLPDFEYNRGKGRFRGWLCHVTGNSVRDSIRKRKTSLEQNLTDTNETSYTSHHSEKPEIEKIANLEWKRYISRLAWKTVSKRFKPRVSKTFLMVAQSIPVEKIAAELKIAESSVYVYKSRVQKELRSEIIRLNRYLS